MARLVALTLAFLAVSAALAADWPMWRCDARRTAATAEALPAGLTLRWTRQLPPQQTAWKDEGEMRFDAAYRPIALGGRLFVASTVNDSVTAYDLASGAQRWRWYAEAPVRVAPAGWKDRLFVAADDGYLTCLNAADGTVRWRFLAGPYDRRMIANERLAGTWPIRTTPAVVDGTVYFAAGVWPFMGTFVYAVDAETGAVRWRNDESSFSYRWRPHPNAAGFSGLSPQATVAVSGNRVVVAGSRSNPGLFDRADGRFIGFAEGRGTEVAAWGSYGFGGGGIYDLGTGNSVRLANAGGMGLPVLGPDAWFAGNILDPKTIVTEAKSVQEMRYHYDANAPVNKIDIFAGTVTILGKGVGQTWLRAGNTLVGAGKRGGLQFYDVTDPKAPKPGAVLDIPGTVRDVLVADGMLVATTAEGVIHAFGKGDGAAAKHELPKPAEPGAIGAPSAEWASWAYEAAGTPDGFAIVCGVEDGEVVEWLARNTGLSIIAVEADAGRVDAVRRRLDAAGLYGARIQVLVQTDGLRFAPYLANLITTERADGLSRDVVRALAPALRPYGGVMALRGRAHYAWLADEARLLPGGAVRARPLGGADDLLLVREGALPGSGDWQGQDADPGRTRCTRDELVFAPLGVLWYGDDLSNTLILPRHGEGPVEQVVHGRLFIEGPTVLNAADVYTGRHLWTRSFPDLGKYYDIAKHQLGAHALGSNFYVVPDAVYVGVGKTCHVLNPATGATMRELTLPEDSTWLFMLVYEDLLIAGLHPQVTPDGEAGRFRYNKPAYSKGLVAMDRRTGEVRWRRDARVGFYHYAVAAGNGRVYAVDGNRLYGLDARTGRELWQTDKCVGDKLSYSAARDIVVSAGALKGADGTVIWDTLTRPQTPVVEAPPPADPEAPPPPVATPSPYGLLWSGKWGLMINGDRIMAQSSRTFDLMTGVQKTWTDASGAKREWSFPRSHGCGPIAASTYLSTFRSGDAGFADLKHESGTGNLGGFRSGCTCNLIVANGVLNAPDYTRTCTCNYQNRSSLGLLHMPDIEFWAHGGVPAPGRVGYNLGAPGDRRGTSGTLWWGRPIMGDGRTPGKQQPVVEPAGAREFYRYAAWMTPGSDLPWVAASGILGARIVTVPLPGIDTAKPLIVRLVFCEPEATAPGARVFDVAVEGKPLATLDLARDAGAMRTVVREATGVRWAGKKLGDTPALTIALTARQGETLLGGIEVVEE